MRRDPGKLTEGPFDLLVLGGGITGAGVTLDAATRGLRAALIDKGDFANGTSSVSSKLVHGGLRYLEHADFRLVWEALHERTRLLHNAPHLVHPLRFLLPLYARARVSAWKWRVGLLLYDVLAGAGNIRRSRGLPEHTTRVEAPGLRSEGLRGAMEFFDAQTDDARLCVEVLRTAAVHGAQVANYVEAVGFDPGDGGLLDVRARDRLTGRDLLIRARQVVNATGPWADAVRRLAGEKAGPLLAPTKGVHLVAPGRGLGSAFLLLHPADGRVFFVIPWLGKTLIGTTDTATDDPPDAVRVTDADMAYLLEGHNHYFRPALTPPDVCGRFAGLRPLARLAPGTAGEAPSDRSRDFEVVSGPPGMLTVVGGKYTTFRHMAEVITDLVVRRLGLWGMRCRTRNLRLDGTPGEPWDVFAPREADRLCRQYPLPRPAAEHLLRRYGRRAEEVAVFAAQDPTLSRPVVAGEPELLAEFVFHREREMAHTPADFLLRRTRLGLFHPGLLDHPPGLARAG
jgi:glycerol-3-phosphate dehydrogenase